MFQKFLLCVSLIAAQLAGQSICRCHIGHDYAGSIEHHHAAVTHPTHDCCDLLATVCQACGNVDSDGVPQPGCQCQVKALKYVAERTECESCSDLPVQLLDIACFVQTDLYESRPGIRHPAREVAFDNDSARAWTCIWIL